MKQLTISLITTSFLFTHIVFCQEVSTILSFRAGVEPAEPRTTLVAGANGVLYGGGDNGLFQLQPPASPGGAWTETTVLSLEELYSAAVAIGPQGELYSTALYPSYQEVFMVTPPAAPGGGWTQTVLYTSTTDPIFRAPLAVGPDGTVYGATLDGGTSTACPNGCGMIFALTPPSAPGGAWGETVLHNFTSRPDGANPTGLTVGANGTIYGTVGQGGKTGRGAVFSLSPPTAPGGAWKEKLIYNFKGSPDGAIPSGGLTIGPDGTLYGVTLLGGTAARGAVFQLTPPAAPGQPWSESVLYSFLGIPDGERPSAGLVIGPGGTIYGVTLWGGKSEPLCRRSGCGTVYQLAPPTAAGGAWTETVLNAFPCGAGGCQPYGGLATDSNGNIYGTTAEGGGRTKGGTAFQIQP